jgi:hypothetical protein
MLLMNYIKVDTLSINQLEIDDLIGLSDEVVRVSGIISLKNGYAITIEDEYGETDIIEFDDYAEFDLYILN